MKHNGTIIGVVIIFVIYILIGFIVGFAIGKAQAVTIEKEAIKDIAEATIEIELETEYYPLTEQEYTELCEVVMAEAGGECYEGQMAVAQCILNACIKDGIRPNEAVVKYQYTDKRKTPTESIKSAVTEVFTDGEKITNEEILFFYAPKYCKSDWHESQRFIIEIGGHRFFALK